jgi:hypothetical protein
MRRLQVTPTMPGFDFPIRTKLAIGAVVGVLLVAGMLAVQQIGDRSAALQREAANNEQLAAIEALRAAGELGRMRLETREIRLAIAPSDVDRANERLHAAAAAAAQHISTAISLSNDPADKDGLKQQLTLAKDYVGVSDELAAAAKDYGDTVQKVQRAVELGNEMNGQIERSTMRLIESAQQRNAQAQTMHTRRRRRSRHRIIRHRRSQRSRHIRRARHQ